MPAKKNSSDKLRFHFKFDRNSPDAYRAAQILRADNLIGNMTTFIVQSILYYTQNVRPDVWEGSKEIVLDIEPESAADISLENKNIKTTKYKKKVLEVPEKKEKTVKVKDLIIDDAQTDFDSDEEDAFQSSFVGTNSTFFS